MASRRSRSRRACDGTGSTTRRASATPSSGPVCGRCLDLVGRDREVAAGHLGREKRLLAALLQELGGLLAVPARRAGGGGLAARRRRAYAVEHVDGLAEAAARQHQPETRVVQAGQQVDVAQLAAPQRRGLLEQPLALALALGQAERLERVDLEHGDRERGLVAAGARQLARQLLLPHATGGETGQ